MNTMKASERFKETIKEYLDKRAEKDPNFAIKYSKVSKSLDECCNYIFNTVQEAGIHGWADEEIFSMAVHYYDEDDVKAPGDLKDLQVIVNHQVQLTEEEKEEARKNAKEKAETDAYNEMKKKSTKRSTQRDSSQATLF